MRPSDALERAALRSPGAPALEGSRRRMTYRELDDEVDRLAAALSGLRDAVGSEGGGSPGSPAGPSERSSHRAGRLALVLESRFDTTLLLHAGPRAGYTVGPLSPSLTSAELASALSALDPTAVFCDAATVDRVRRAGEGRRVYVVDGIPGLVEALGALGGGALDERAERGKTEGRAVGEGPDARLREEEPGYVVWTSGSSGSPRGVLLTGTSLATVIEGSARRLGLTSSDRWLTTLSLAHVGGLATVLRTAHLGSTLVVRDSFDEGELLDLASRERVTHASLVPVMLRRVLAEGDGDPCPPGLRCLLVGGAHAPPELVREAVALGYPVALTYGTTETSSQSATAAPQKVRAKPHVVGPPLPGVEVRVAESGEIRVRGPSLATGYVGVADPTASRTAPRTSASARSSGSRGTSGSPGDSPSTGSGARVAAPLDLDEEGWYRTGDLGRWDDDGDLIVTGRRSERIVTGGVTVDPGEVEEALLRIPWIDEAVVVGVPDEEWGERVSAALVLAATEGASRETRELCSRSDRCREEPEARVRKIVDQEMRLRLSGPKRPRRVRFLDALPRTPSGKVDRERVRRLLGESAADPPDPLP